MKNNKILVISDGLLGHQNQSAKIAENLSGKKPDILTLERRRPLGRLCALINPILITTEAEKLKKTMQKNEYGVVIGTGTLPKILLLWIKKNYPNVKTICLLDPGSNYDKYDVVAVPNHDNVSYSGPNLVRFTGSLSCLSKAELEEEKENFKDIFSSYKKPLIGVSFGGESSDYSFGVDKAEEMLSKIKEIADKENASVYGTTSRRTSEKTTEYIEKFFKDNKYTLYTGKGENPYRGILSHSDMIVVTPETVSMLSEACATNAQILVYDRKAIKNKRIKKFLQEIFEKGLVEDMDDYISKDGKIGDVKTKSGSYMERQMHSVVDFIKNKI